MKLFISPTIYLEFYLTCSIDHIYNKISHLFMEYDIGLKFNKINEDDTYEGFNHQSPPTRLDIILNINPTIN